jgi:putative endonuclease
VYFVYILCSQKNSRFYIGYSEDRERRLSEHNSGKVKSTRAHRPWTKVYSETYQTEIEAIRRERYLKAQKSRKFLLELIGRHVPIENRDG